MKIQAEAHYLTLLLLFPALTSGVTLDCDRVVADGKSWTLTPLAGPHSVYHVVEHPPTTINTTYTIDLCKPLKETECPSGTMVCGVQRSSDDNKLLGAIPIAGIFVQNSGRNLNPKVTRLKASDSQHEGLRIELHGGKYPFNGKDYDQQAVIEMTCDRSRSGLEGDWSGKMATLADEDGPGDDKKDGKTDDDKKAEDKSLRFKSYGQVDNVFVLRLDWVTKHACEDFEDDGSGKAAHWGFFTWLIVIVFLCTSAYLIFGSWLNYNRYGARGWDLLPHGDTIRDIPYILKDWGRKVVTTVQGPGPRGGYSAV
ncbi:conserved hypothetical protein [Histoplasma capsulatum var. duboisii H88]|uniref:Autophagy-related protein 27 n=2 Tax=Ajellomyces capsulatus TaxID=5037 RepID=F0UDN4_AJEC8|nr:conserved hypothetical protein [Histoplasma capsulatum H143]EGC43565.1 conserved hypothetical protein [Histoplasma capsulatum var. duboisii H88]QSS49728.1 autophagy protein [Histoplasma capsulatum var. duboisii H88]